MGKRGRWRRRRGVGEGCGREGREGDGREGHGEKRPFSLVLPLFFPISSVPPVSTLPTPLTPLPTSLSPLSTPLTPCLGLICSDLLIIHLGLEVRFGDLLFTVLWRRPGAQKKKKKQGREKGKENTAGKAPELWCHCAY